LIVWISPSTMVGASPSDGSSMIRSFGLVSSARPMASICCSPPDSEVPLTFLRSASRGNSSYTRAGVHAAALGAPTIWKCSSTVSDWNSRRPCGT
jgi:hypothetical protein